MLGDLCHKASTSDLAHAYQGSSLIFKSTAPAVADIKISATFDPLTWVCNTYHVEHDGQIDIEPVWRQNNIIPIIAPAGSFTITGAEFTPLTQSLQMNVWAHDACAAHENPNITVTFRAIQGDKTIFSDIFDCPLGIDEEGIISAKRSLTLNLSAGIIQSFTAGAMPNS